MPLSIREGEIIADKYRVTRALAEGGMGVIVAAQHLKLEQRVALKFMLPELAQSPDAVARFLREARAAAQIQSEHVARILDVSELETGLPYIVMEYLEGSDLAGLVQGPRTVAVSDAVDFILQACEALAEAHARGIIHRDLKPENLFLTRRHGQPWIKVLDFGISKVTGDARREGVKITTRDTMGSPAYMSPEQMRSTGDVDARSDIWSLGVILYELLTRRQPFYGDSIAAICLQVIQHEPPPLEGRCPGLPAGLAEVVSRCLAKRRDDRYASIPELVRALAPFAPARSQTVITSAQQLDFVPASTRDLSVPPLTTRTHVALRTTGQRRGYRAPLLVLGGITLLAALGASPLSRALGPATPAAAEGQPLAASTAPLQNNLQAAALPAPVSTPSPAEPAAPAVTAQASASALPTPKAPPTTAGPAQSSKSGEPPRPGPASKGGRLTASEPLQAQAPKRAPAPEEPKASDEDIFSARK